MSRVVLDFDSLLKPESFEEVLSFSTENPYRIYIKRFRFDDIVPLHYAKTVEILFCSNLSGHIFIQDTLYELKGKQIFVIPPGIAHSNEISACDGEMIVLKISISDLSHYVHLDHFLSICGNDIDHMCHYIPEPSEIMEIPERIIRKDDDLPSCISCLLELLIFFSRQENISHSVLPETNLNNTGLQQLITWTESHYAEKIRLEDVAAMFGYTKYYFCSLFRTLTGTTYFRYLNSVRISHACDYLKNGCSVQDVSTVCGFDSCSYFIQSFKKMHHMTPRQYAEQSKAVSISFSTAGVSESSTCKAQICGKY